MSNRALPHVPALDGLRGVAILGVVAFHAGLLPGGWLGVDLFFVLSGFLITTLLVEEREATGRIALGRFWARRARRLLPALFVALIGVGVYAAALAQPEELPRIRGDGLATLGYVANWRAVLLGDDYWALFLTRSPLEHTWSLAIEEQLYLLWPLTVVGVLGWRRGSRRALFAVSLGLALASAVWAMVLYGPRTTGRVYYGTDTRAAALLVGAALAAIAPYVHTTTHASRTRLEVLAFFALLVLGLTWARTRGEDPRVFRGVLLAASVAAGVIVASASHPLPGPIARALSPSPLRWLGKVSYGLYLWHWPVFVALTRERVHLPEGVLLAAKIGVSLGLAALSFVLVEKPIRSGAFSARQMRVVAPLATATTAFALLVTTMGGRALPPAGVIIDEPASPRDLSAPHPLRILLVGDSVGARLAPAFAQAAHEAHATVDTRAIVGCGLVRGSQRTRDTEGTIRVRRDCPDWEKQWSLDVERYVPDVAVVILAAPSDGDLDIEGRWLHPCDPAFDDYYADETRRAATVLSSRGAAAVFATMPYVERGEARWGEVRERTDCVNDAVRTGVARSPAAEVADLASFVCPTLRCRERMSGIPLRPDGLHFEGEGALLVARWLMGALDELPVDGLRALARPAP